MWICCTKQDLWRLVSLSNGFKLPIKWSPGQRYKTSLKNKHTFTKHHEVIKGILHCLSNAHNLKENIQLKTNKNCGEGPPFESDHRMDSHHMVLFSILPSYEILFLPMKLCPEAQISPENAQSAENLWWGQQASGWAKEYAYPTSGENKANTTWPK